MDECWQLRKPTAHKTFGTSKISDDFVIFIPPLQCSGFNRMLLIHEGQSQSATP
jgi:hypothetical protein